MNPSPTFGYSLNRPRPYAKEARNLRARDLFREKCAYFAHLGWVQLGLTIVDALLAATTLPSSQEIQQALANLGLYQGKIDGKIGPKTKQAIRDFQAKNDLRVDGKVGPQTWSKLSSYLQASASTAPATTNSGPSD